MEKRKYRVTITVGGESFTILGDTEPERVQKLAALYDERLRQTERAPAGHQQLGPERRQLQRRLPFGQQGDGQLHPLARADLAQGADGEFPEEDQPRGQQDQRLGAQRHEAQHRAADQDLVADGVEDRAPHRHRVHLPGQPAVEPVGGRGDDEGRDR